MRFLKYHFPVAIILLITVIVAGCGGTTGTTTTPTPTATTTPLPHQLTVLADANGQQVEYDGHLLYAFVGDSAAGQAHGEGIVSFGGTWHVVTPNL